MGNICGTQSVEAQQPYAQPRPVHDGATQPARQQDIQTDTKPECVTQAAKAQLAELRTEPEVKVETRQEDWKTNTTDSEMPSAGETVTTTEVTNDRLDLPKMEPKEQVVQEAEVKEVKDGKKAEEVKDVQDVQNAVEVEEVPHVKDVKDTPSTVNQPAATRDSASVDVAKPQGRMETSTGPPEWIVVGGGEKGGIVVRKSKRIGSKELPRLMMGARIQELERSGERVRFEKKEGAGPKTGWVSAIINGKDLLQRA